MHVDHLCRVCEQRRGAQRVLRSALPPGSDAEAAEQRPGESKNLFVLHNVPLLNRSEEKVLGIHVSWRHVSVVSVRSAHFQHTIFPK